MIEIEDLRPRSIDLHTRLIYTRMLNPRHPKDEHAKDAFPVHAHLFRSLLYHQTYADQGS